MSKKNSEISSTISMFEVADFSMFQNRVFWWFNIWILYSFLPGVALRQRRIHGIKQMMVYDEITFFVKTVFYMIFGFLIFDVFSIFRPKNQKKLRKNKKNKKNRTDWNQTDRNRTARLELDRRTRPDPDRSDIRGAKASHHGSWIMDQRSSIEDHGSWIKYQVSSIQYQGSWTLFWHEWPSWTGYRREIKTIRIYYQRSIILYRFYKDRVMNLGSWTLFWHEWPF